MKKVFKIIGIVLTIIVFVFLIIYAYIQYIEIQVLRNTGQDLYKEHIDLKRKYENDIKAYQDTIKAMRLEKERTEE